MIAVASSLSLTRPNKENGIAFEVLLVLRSAVSHTTRFMSRVSRQFQILFGSPRARFFAFSSEGHYFGHHHHGGNKASKEDSVKKDVLRN